jgi:hypothetical protein
MEVEIELEVAGPILKYFVATKRGILKFCVVRFKPGFGI